MSDNLMPTECPFCGAVVVAKTHGGFYPYWEHIDFKCGTHWTANMGFKRECASDLRLSPAPNEQASKRAEVAEAFLHAAETFSLDTEGCYEDLAERIDAQTRKPNTLPRERAMFTAMAAVLEEAARDA